MNSTSILFVCFLLCEFILQWPGQYIGMILSNKYLWIRMNEWRYIYIYMIKLSSYHLTCYAKEAQDKIKAVNIGLNYTK